MSPREQREQDAWQHEAQAYQRVREAERPAVPYSEFQAAVAAWARARREHMASMDEHEEAEGTWVDEIMARHVGSVQRELGL